MEHLVYLHDSGVYKIESGDSEDITGPCKECGERNEIYLSWYEEERNEVLEKFLTGTDKDPTNIIKAYEKGVTRDELISGTRIYFATFREVIDSLFLSESISEGDMRKYTRLNKMAEKKQLERIKRNIPIINIKSILKLKNNK